MTAVSELRHRVRIQEPVRSDDGGGGGVAQWLDVREVWAKVQPLTAFQRLKAEQVQNRMTHAVTIRYGNRIEPGFRLLYGTRFLMVIGIEDEEELHRWLVLSCEEVPEH